MKKLKQNMWEIENDNKIFQRLLILLKMLLYTRITRNKILPMIFLFNKIILKVNSILSNLLFSLQIFFHLINFLVLALFKPPKNTFTKRIIEFKWHPFSNDILPLRLCIYACKYREYKLPTKSHLGNNYWILITYSRCRHFFLLEVLTSQQD